MQMKKRKWKPTLYASLVLLLLVGMALGIVLHKKENPLLNEQNAITLYKISYQGEVPVFDTENYFPEEDLDYSKVSYDTSQCDFDTPGVYQVPVLYDGAATNCEVQLTVKSKEEERQASAAELPQTFLEAE